MRTDGKLEHACVAESRKLAGSWRNVKIRQATIEGGLQPLDGSRKKLKRDRPKGHRKKMNYWERKP